MLEMNLKSLHLESVHYNVNFACLYENACIGAEVDQ